MSFNAIANSDAFIKEETDSSFCNFCSDYYLFAFFTLKMGIWFKSYKNYESDSAYLIVCGEFHILV
jgi:hypothetical protein